ncbi:MAG: lysoplasmalogenase, partial [Bacteroidales bacterium]|nr:lysoplasmalogenase [Bacteroidales bacterium]
FFIGLYIDNYIMRMIAKPFPLLMLISMVKRDTHYGKFIFFGLIFSVIGDVLLEASPSFFAFGLVAFLIAHINYIIAFVGRDKGLNLLATPLIIIYGAALYWILFPTLKEMAIPVFFYIIVILSMVWRAFAQRKFDNFAKLALFGSLFFVFSDSLIALNKFYIPLEYSRGVIMVTYWTAQVLIFSSVFAATTKSEQ